MVLRNRRSAQILHEGNECELTTESQRSRQDATERESDDQAHRSDEPFGLDRPPTCASAD